MILTAPTKLKLPNYNININFVEDDTDSESIQGVFLPRDYSVAIAKTEDEAFNKYLYITFVTFAAGVVHDINLNQNKGYTLGLFFYHIFEFNDVLKMFGKFKRKKKFDSFKVSVPSFELDIAHSVENRAPLGQLKLAERQVYIFYSCTAHLKNVILMHELIEWANGIFSLNLKHMEIQCLAESFAYILTKNKFTT